MEKGNTFPTWSFDIHLSSIHSDIFDKIDNLTFIVLTITVPVFNQPGYDF